MSNKIANFTMFVIGMAIGSAATWCLTKKKYEQIAQDEIDSVKEVFSKRENEDESACIRIKAEQAKTKMNIAEYTAKLHEQGYTNYSNMGVSFNKGEEKKESMKNIDKPFVIPPEEFDEFDDYEKISLIYYADQILADDNDERIEDVDNIVGSDALESFGEYEDDSVFVRNNKLKCDYEILLDQRKFSDVIRRKPHEVDE